MLPYNTHIQKVAEYIDKVALKELPMYKLRSLRNAVHLKSQAANRSLNQIIDNPAGHTIQEAQEVANKFDVLSRRSSNLKSQYNMKQQVNFLADLVRPSFISAN